MTVTLPEVYIGKNAISELEKFIALQQYTAFTLVTDENEYEALGRAVEATIRRIDRSLHTIVLPGSATPDETYLIQVLLEPDERRRVYLGVGSGTLTDIVRFSSHRAGMPFISLPTAPSVDGFASTGCALTIQKYKQTIMAAAPVGIFADLDTLTRAPRPLIASGFGDMFGKYTALADWPISYHIAGEAFSQELADRSRGALQTCVDQVSVLHDQWETAMHKLMEGLVEEGICMLLQGNSRPASGAEHVISHYWEMKLAREDRPPVFHGAKVGLAAILVARYYELLRQISREEALERLQAARMPAAEDEIARIRSVFGTAAELILAVQQKALQQTPEQFAQMCRKIGENWDLIQQFAATVPTSAEIRDLLVKVGGATHPNQLGLTDTDVQEALEYALYLRKYFTILNLGRILAIPAPEKVF